MSASEIAARKSREVRERNMLRRAMEISAEERKRMQEMEEGERLEMERAMRLSWEESVRSSSVCGGCGDDDDDDDDDDNNSGEVIMGDEEFERLLETSRLEEMERRRVEEERDMAELERALRLSEVDHYAATADGDDDESDAEDEDLRRVLSLSAKESSHPPLPNYDDDKDQDEIQRAIRESLEMAAEDSAVGLDGIEGDGHLDDEEAEMIRRAMELSIKAEAERNMLELALNLADTGTSAAYEDDDSAGITCMGSVGRGGADEAVLVGALGEPPPPSMAPPQCTTHNGMYID